MPKKRAPKKTSSVPEAASPAGRAKATDLPDAVTPAEPAPSSEPVVSEVVEEIKEPIKIRESTATGDEKVEILNHELLDVHEDNRGVPQPARVDVAIHNLTDSTIATIVIEVVFYDIEGNVLETAKHQAIELFADRARAIRIESKVMEPDKVKSYDVRITRTRTAEQERVQLRVHDINPNAAGEDVVEGVVKNISKVQADAAVVITFYGANNVEIGRKVVVLRDIEPETIRQYALTFKPHEGDRVGTYNVAIGELAR